MKVDVFKLDGTKSGESIELSDKVFVAEPNDHVIYLSVKAHLANRRQGTAKAKERSEVSGTTKKPWRQKGRGTARAGSFRSPLWVGGGTVFGPKPRNYRQKLNKKVSRLARISALSYKVKANQLFVIEDFNFDNPKTKEFNKILENLKVDGKKTLVLTNGNLENIYKSGRNIEKVQIAEATNASAYDLLNNQVVVLQKSAVESLEKILIN